MNRRTFLESLAQSLAASRAVVGAPSRTAYAATRLDRVGLELYSVRNAMKRDPEATLAAVRTAGYEDVELLWSLGNFGRTPEQVRASLDRDGLRAPSAHIDPETITGDWTRSLETAKLLGHQYLIVPSLTPETAHSLDAWRTWADRFNAAGSVARSAGIWLAFHNEPEHMKPIDGAVPYDLFVERTDPTAVRLQLDVGNMALGGADPMRYLRRYNDRYYSFHIKDVVADRSHDTELGTGVLDLRALLAAIPDIRGKPIYVEQESPSDELASARRNYRYVSTLDF